MTDYFTLDNDDATRYPESTQNENEFRTMIDAEVVDADEILDDGTGLDAPEPIRLIDEPMEDDGDEVDDNPVAALADTFPVQVKPLAAGESAFNEEEARRRTEELKVKLLHALEAQYDLIQAAQAAFEGHIWVALGYPQGMRGWEAYCKDHFTSDQIRVTGQARTDLILGFDPSKISNRGIAALLGVHHSTVDRTITKAGREKARKVIGADGPVLDAAVPVRQLLEQLVAKTGLPPFLLGLSWSSTERMSAQQADLLTSELWALRRAVEPVLLRICTLWLRLHGCGCAPEIVWDDISLQDLVEEAQADLYRARTEQLRKGT